MLFKGDSFVLTGTNGERSPFGAWTNTYDYAGVPGAIAALVNSQPIGPVISTKQDGAVVTASLTYAPDTFADKWEVDFENLEKDLMFNPSFTVISTAGKDEIRRWRADPTTTLDATKDATHTALMNQVADLVRRGVESTPVTTLVLKRTRSMSTTLAPTIVLTQRVQFYSTAQLVAQTGMDAGIAATLPNPTSANGWAGAYAPPSDAAWGWMPRQANRSYCARGQMEEHSDWVFAAWSTVMFTLVP